MSTLRLAPGAIADIRRILRRSKAEFGPGGGARYKALLDQALQDLEGNPSRIGVRSVADIRPGYFVYHVKFSKPRVTAQPGSTSVRCIGRVDSGSDCGSIPSFS